MLDLNDKRWAEMKGGYRVPFDPRPLLAQLERSKKLDETWYELIGELFHQGDVGEASYAAVPHLVRIHGQRGLPDANTYSLVATIDLARGEGKNPEVPKWLQPGYDNAISALAAIGLRELTVARKMEEIQSVLALLAIWKGARTYGRLLNWYAQDELYELVEKGLNADGHGQIKTGGDPQIADGVLRESQFLALLAEERAKAACARIYSL
ncbi:MAG TPA: hypothetical protein VF394_12340 [Candidatus Acidoferrum sp.]